MDSPEPDATPEPQPQTPSGEPPDGTGGDGGADGDRGEPMPPVNEPEPVPQPEPQAEPEPMPEGCEGGPLELPIDGCSPSFEETGDFYEDCVARINQLRWECQCLPPLERWVEGEACADQHAEYDYQQDRAHAGISDNICEPGGGGQNECPGYSPNFGIIDFCLQQMWDEGPGEDFQAHGHYLNMTSEGTTKVACGIYETPDGEIWSVQNFSR